MNTLTEDDVDALRARLDAEPEPPAWSDPMYAADPDDDDSDGETDEAPTVEVEVPVIVDMDPDNLRVLQLTLGQHEVLDALRNRGVPIRGVSAGLAHIPHRLYDRVGHIGYDHLSLVHHLREGMYLSDDSDDDLAYLFRPSPVLGGTLLLFDLTPAFPGA